MVETPFKVEQIPFMPPARREERFSMYFKGKNPRAVAVSPTGAIGYFFEQASHEEAMRRSLETCGWRGGVPCRIIAIDDMFILPMPQSMRIAAFFLPRRANMIIETEREGIAQKLANNPGGWSAVAVGGAGRTGVAIKAASEEAAVAQAKSECGKIDAGCRIVAIGPWAVEPK
jgi:adenylate cyclase